jgi:hypothetical protein
VPVIAFLVTRRVCRELQAGERLKAAQRQAKAESAP